MAFYGVCMVLFGGFVVFFVFFSQVFFPKFFLCCFLRNGFGRCISLEDGNVFFWGGAREGRCVFLVCFFRFCFLVAKSGSF